MAVYVSDLFTATPAPVDANPTATRTFQWLRGSTAISGATSSTYTAVTADIGSSLSTTQFETNFLSSVTATSASTEVVQAFDPIRLFSSSEPGVWYDPNDAANLDWRRNLLLQTDQFESSTWTKLATTVTANAAAAPDGTMTADKIIASAASGEHGIYQTTSGTTGTVYVVAKAAEYTNLRMGELGNYWFYASFDLITGVVSGTGGPRFSSAYMVSLGDGWWQCVIKHTSVGTVPFTFGGFPTGATGFALANFTGNGTSGVFVAQSQAEQGTVATEYQPITDLNTEVIARFPNATLYQDTTGTAPVTTPGQTVGLMLDKSRGLTLGPELVTNGTFDTNITGWTDGAWSSGSASAIDGEMVVVIPSGAAYYRKITPISVVVGKTYVLSGDVRVVSGSGSSILAIGTSSAGISPEFILNGGRVVFTATAATMYVSAGNPSGTSTGYSLAFDNISVKELPGLHATQPTLASRPTYGIVPTGGRRNLLTYTEDYSNAAYTGAGVTFSGQTATFATGGYRYGAYNVGTSIAGRTFTASVVVSSATKSTIAFRMSGSATGSDEARLVINLTPTPTRYTLTRTFTSTDTAIQIGLDNRPLASGDGIAGDLVATQWQFEAGPTATAYQKVTTQYDVTEAGVPSLGYLFFDGVNDWMVTPTITPGTDKSQVFTGVRRLNENVSIIAELSADAGANNGTFHLAQNTGPLRWQALSKGTIFAVADTAMSTGPASEIASSISDIGGDRVTLRVNGVQVSQTTTDQGPGNYLAYPMYLGMRAGTSLPLQGHIHSLIVRFGPNLTTARIAATETWVASKTAGVTL